MLGSRVCRDVKERFDAQKASRAQRILSSMVVLEDRLNPNSIEVVAGLDVAYRRPSSGRTEIGIGVAIAINAYNYKPIRCVACIRPVCIPYIPGLLAFREMYVLAPALQRLVKKVDIDVIVVDGHGIAHPRGLGIASHVGVVFNKPSIGVAKKKLFGEVVEEDGKLLVKDRGRAIGVVVEKIYVSPGTMVSLESSEKIIRRMLKTRLPEPIRIADKVSKELRKEAYKFLAEDIVFIDCLPYTKTSTLVDYFR